MAVSDHGPCVGSLRLRLFRLQHFLNSVITFAENYLVPKYAKEKILKLFSFTSKREAVVKPSSTSSEMSMGLKAKLVCNNICILKKIGDLSLAAA